MGKLQHEFGKSANTMMDNPGTIQAMQSKADSLTVPEDFKGNPSEFKRRSLDGLQRLMGDAYMLAIQNGQTFNLKATLGKLSQNETPTSLHQRAATIENRVITAGEKVDPAMRLRNGTESQQRFLEAGADALREEHAKTGTVSPTGPISDLAKQSMAQGLKPADVANYAAITQGVPIPAETLAAVAAIPKEPAAQALKPAASGPAPAQAAPAASTPAASAPAAAP